MNPFNLFRFYNLRSAKSSGCFNKAVYHYFNKNNGSHYLSTTTTASEAKKIPLIERWKRYWKDLVTDYHEVLKETIEDGKKNPKKSAFLFTCAAVVYTCFKTNPDNIDYRESVIKCCNEVLLVGKPIRNKTCEEFLTSMETCYNLDVVRRLSFGLFSVIWIDNYSSELGVYKAKCSYLKPQYITFFNRVVDIGIFGKWWKLDSVMKNYDVNEEEWIESSNNNVTG